MRQKPCEAHQENALTAARSPRKVALRTDCTQLNSTEYVNDTTTSGSCQLRYLTPCCCDSLAHLAAYEA